MMRSIATSGKSTFTLSALTKNALSSQIWSPRSQRSAKVPSRKSRSKSGTNRSILYQWSQRLKQKSPRPRRPRSQLLVGCHHRNSSPILEWHTSQVQICHRRPKIIPRPTNQHRAQRARSLRDLQNKLKSTTTSKSKRGKWRSKIAPIQRPATNYSNHKSTKASW